MFARQAEWREGWNGAQEAGPGDTGIKKLGCVTGRGGPKDAVAERQTSCFLQHEDSSGMWLRRRKSLGPGRGWDALPT